MFFHYQTWKMLVDVPECIKCWYESNLCTCPINVHCTLYPSIWRDLLKMCLILFRILIFILKTTCKGFFKRSNCILYKCVGYEVCVCVCELWWKSLLKKCVFFFKWLKLFNHYKYFFSSSSSFVYFFFNTRKAGY